MKRVNIYQFHNGMDDTIAYDEVIDTYCQY
jgi:hypothetical protein